MVYNDSSDWLVSITSGKGPCGSVTYQEGAETISFPWEFVFGGDSIAYIDLSLVKWTNYPWAIERRTEILQRVAQEVIRQKAPDCIAELSENSIAIVKPKQPSPSKNQASPSTKTVTSCPSCTQKLRAPIDRGELMLTCPKCKHSWLWNPS